IPIRLLAHHGLEGVRDRYDAGEDVYLPARRFSWIALRVPALVVLEADEADVVGIHELLRYYPVGKEGVGAHLLRLIFGQGAFLLDYRIGNPEHARIVKQRARRQVGESIGRQLEGYAYDRGENGRIDARPREVGS